MLDESESYSRRLDAWFRADIETLAGLADEVAADYPDVHRQINVERSTRWAERIREMLANDDVEFVSIGIAHLVGPDNLLSQLRAAGAQVERLDGSSN